MKDPEATPETDAAKRKMQDIYDTGKLLDGVTSMFFVMARLERERNEARRKAEQWRQRCLHCTPWSTYEHDKKLPWER